MATDLPIQIDTLTPPACYSTEQERADAYAAAMYVTVNEGYAQWVISATTPVVGDRDKIWLRLDVDGNPVEALKWVAGAASWVRWFSLPLYSDSNGGAANAYTSTYSPALVAEDIQVGKIFLFKAAFANTGSATWSPNGLGPYTLKKNVSDNLTANDIIINQMVMVQYDGTNMQVLSLLGTTGDLSPGTDGQTYRTRTVATVLTPKWETSVYKTPVGSLQNLPAAGNAVTFAHGLQDGDGAPITPVNYGAFIYCNDVGGDATYSQGDEIPWDNVKRTDLSETEHMQSVYANTAYVGAVRGSVSTGLYVNSKTGGVLTSIDTAKWKIGAWATI